MAAWHKHRVDRISEADLAQVVLRLLLELLNLGFEALHRVSSVALWSLISWVVHLEYQLVTLRWLFLGRIREHIIRTGWLLVNEDRLALRSARDTAATEVVTRAKVLLKWLDLVTFVQVKLGIRAEILCLNWDEVFDRRILLQTRRQVLEKILQVVQMILLFDPFAE